MDDGLSVLPIAQAHVLRWVLMGGNINESRVFLAWPYRLCPGVSTAVRAPLGVCVVGNVPGRGLCGLCLAHCWVLRQQDLFAAMHLGHLLVFLLFLLPVSPVTVSSPVFVGVVVSGGLVDGVVV